MLMGDRTNTVNFVITYWWDHAGSQDLRLGNAVGSWIGQNQKVLDKKRSDDALKLIVEQFPYLKEVECRHAQLQSARYRA